MAELSKGPFTLIEAVRRAAILQRVKLVEEGVWVTAYGVALKLSELELGHLANILNLYKLQRPPFDIPGLAERLLKPLLKEARRRGFKDVEAEEVDRFKLIETT